MTMEMGGKNIDTNIYLSKCVCFDEEWKKMERLRWRGEDNEELKRTYMNRLE